MWKGTAFGGARGRTDVPKIVDWYMEGKINIDDLITHTLPLDEINKGFDLMHAGKSIRSVVRVLKPRGAGRAREPATAAHRAMGFAALRPSYELSQVHTRLNCFVA